MEADPLPAADGSTSTPEGGTTLTHTQTDRCTTGTSRRKTAGPMYRLYVIRLKDAAVDTNKMREANPNAVSRKPVVYVGMTKQTRDARFAEHMAGGMRSARLVRKLGRRLFPWAYRNCRTYRTKAKAEAAERAHAEALRERGWFVWQN